MDVLLLFREESFICGFVFGGFFLLLRDGVDVFSGFIVGGVRRVFLINVLIFLLCGIKGVVWIINYICMYIV